LLNILLCCVWDNICDDTLVARTIFAKHHNRLLHGRVLLHERLDLAQLDPEAAQLHLLIDASYHLHRPVVEEARPIAGFIEPRSRAAAERMGDKSLRSQLWSTEVASRQALTADVELAGDADGDRLKLLV
jgi:hypothetical protein